MYSEDSKKISDLDGRFICMVSTGKDSIAMLHIILNDFKIDKSRITFIYMYFYPKGVLTYRDKYISFLEKKYGIEILYSPHYETWMINSERPKITFSENREFLLKRFNADWYFYGWWKGEGLATNIMLKHSVNGIPAQYSCDGKRYRDPQNHLYPLFNMNEGDVWDYIKNNNLILSPEYDYGFRDIAIFRAETAKWLKNVFPEDYERACRHDKMIEIEYFKVTNE